MLHRSVTLSRAAVACISSRAITDKDVTLFTAEHVLRGKPINVVRSYTIKLLVYRHEVLAHHSTSLTYDIEV